MLKNSKVSNRRGSGEALPGRLPDTQRPELTELLASFRIAFLGIGLLSGMSNLLILPKGLMREPVLTWTREQETKG